MLQSMGSQRVGHDLVTGQHSCVDHVSPLLLVRRVVWLLAHLSPECVGRYSLDGGRAWCCGDRACPARRVGPLCSVATWGPFLGPRGSPEEFDQALALKHGSSPKGGDH